jgi:diguanylate cyclase (GGDEF)-like protein/PAS domain S-box-containing protein
MTFSRKLDSQEQAIPTRILIVEDESIIAFNLQEILEFLGYDVVSTVVSGEQAIDRAAQLSSDLILMDIRLKGKMDGIEAAHQIWEQFEIPTVYLTGYSDKTTLEKALSSSHFGYLLKPINEGELYVAVESALQRAARERWISGIIKNIGDALIVVDIEGHIQYLNPLAETLTEWKLNDAKEQPLIEVFNVIQQKTGLSIEHSVKKVIEEGNPIYLDSDLLLVTKKGHSIAVSISMSPFRDNKDTLTGVILVFQDTTARQKAQETLREQAELINLTYEAIFVCNANGEIIFWNRSAQFLYGWTSSEVEGKIADELLKTEFPFDSPDVQSVIQEKGKWEGELTHTRRDGTKIIVESRQVLVRKESEGRIKGVLVVNRDITERKLAETKLQYQALHDALTGLPNRLLLTERIEGAIKRSQRKPNSLYALLFIDLDRFKNINDSLGHLVGDQLLVAISQRLGLCVRESDTVSRLGGDEFVIFLDELQQEQQALKVAERIFEQLKDPIIIDGRDILITVSIGIAFNTDQNSSATELLRNADLAMYRAKKQNGSTYGIFNPRMHEQAQTLWELESNLRLAVERQEFFLVYQPIFCLTTETLIGFEALVRWQNPQQGLISPREFIPMAEETGLMVPLGEWILHEACQQLVLWQQEYSQAHSLKMSVNISSQQMEMANFLDRFDQILAATKLPATSLVLEITETLLMRNLEAATVLLLELKKRQIKISIDDFGTGYSSLSYLCYLPVNSLKIDRSFVTEINAKSENLKIVQAIISLAQQLNLKVIAEGIETQENLWQLQKLDCQYGQGYFFAKPLESSQAKQLIQQSC